MAARTQSIYRSAAGRDEIMALYEKVLAGWPVPSEHLRVPTRHGETFVVGSGDRLAPPLVLLHGSGSNSATWAGDVRLYSRCCRVYAVDIPGEPGKSSPVRFSCHGPSFREWLDDVLDGLGVERSIMGGMSLGAWAALDYAIYRPERVIKAILICPSGIYPPRPSFGLAALFFLRLGDWGIERMKRLIFENAPVTPDAERFFMLTGRHFKYRMEAPAIIGDDELRRAQMPILFLAGEHDAVLQSLKTAQRLQKVLPHARACVFGGDGHALISVGQEVLAFLQEGQAPGVS